MIFIYRIGEFATLVNSSIKTIRYYDEIDLLKPSTIDKFTSYRYYNEDNIKEYYSIILLKRMGFSLEEIKLYKDNLCDEMFLKQREKIINEILEKKKIIKIIDDIRSNIVNGEIKLDNYVLGDIETKSKNIGGLNGK